MGLIERRIGLLFAVFVVLFSIAIGRAAWIQAVQGGSLAEDAHLQQTDALTIPGARGAILDRNGKELAVSEDAADVIATPFQVSDLEATAHKLARVLGVPEDGILESLGDGSAGFAYIARQVDLPRAERVKRATPGRAAAPGVRARRSARRAPSRLPRRAVRRAGSDRA